MLITTRALQRSDRNVDSRAAHIPIESAGAKQMKKAYFRFYAELNDLLPLPRRGQTLSHAFETTTAVKDAIEAFGVRTLRSISSWRTASPLLFPTCCETETESACIQFFVRSILVRSHICSLGAKAKYVSCSTRILASWHLICECWASTVCIVMTVRMRSSRISPAASNGLY